MKRVRVILEGPIGDRFLRRVLTETEYEAAAARSGRLAEFAAGRFAAKEAVVKALGCGIGEAVGFRDIEIAADKLGKPECRLSKRTKEKLGLGDGDRLMVSISHSEDSAIAFAVWERGERE